MKFAKQLRGTLELLRAKVLIPDHQHMTLDKGAV